MCLNVIVIAGFYEPARHAIRYADTLAQAVHGNLVLLHVNRVSLFDPYELVGAAGGRLRKQELQRQGETAAALRQLAQRLHAPTTVEMATDLLPNVARELAARYSPVLFVLGQPDEDHPDFAGMAAMCAELLRAGHFPILAVPTAAPAEHPPHRFLIAADREPFDLSAASQALRPLLALLGTDFVVAHVSAGVDDDDGCAEALRAVRRSRLVEFSNPELQGYVDSDYAEGLLAATVEARADVVVLLARERSFMSDLFHRSVTARLLGRCPVPVLALAADSDPPRPTLAEQAAAAIA